MPINYQYRYNTDQIPIRPKQIRSNTDQMPIKYLHWQNGTNNDKYRYNTDWIPIQYIPLSLFPSTVHFFKSTHPRACPLLSIHRGAVTHHRGPRPVSHRQYMSQIHPRRSRKCSKSLYTHWPYPNLSGPLSLWLWLWLSLSLSHTHTHSLSLFRTLISLSFSLLLPSDSRWLCLPFTPGSGLFHKDQDNDMTDKKKNIRSSVNTRHPP